MLEEILEILKECVKEVDEVMTNKSTIALSEVEGTTNKSGDNVKKLDSITNEIFVRRLSRCKEIRYLVSEEVDDKIWLNDEGKYMVAFDPLDGSSNILFNITTGSIFGVYDLEENSIVLGGYSLYGFSTQLVIAMLDKVTIYQFMFGCVFLTIKDDYKMPEKGNVYLTNSSKMYLNDKRWNKYIDTMIEKGYNSRWTGSLVADAHRVLLEGGVFLYPKNSKNNRGKIRLLYEAQPIGYIIEKAGGSSWGFDKPLTDIQIYGKNHDRTQIILSSSEEFKEFMKIFYLHK